MRWAWILLLISGAALAAEVTVPAQYGWQREGLYVYRVTIETTEGRYRARYAGPVIYLCRAANPHGFTLRCYNRAQLHRFTLVNRRFPPFGVFQMGWRWHDGRSTGQKRHGPVDFVFQPTGEIIERTGTSPLLDLLDPTRLVLDRLSDANQTRWQSQRATNLIHERRVADPNAVRVVRLDKLPLTATIKETFSREGTRLHHELELQTAKAPVSIAIRGRGFTRFGPDGTPLERQWNGTITEQLGEARREVPLKINYHRLTGAAAEEVLRPAAPASRIERRPLAATELARHVASVGQRLSHLRPVALEAIATADPAKATAQQQAEVSRALVLALSDTDPFIRANTVRALANWAQPEAIPALIRALNDRQMPVRWAAIDALGARRDPRGLEPVVRHLGSGRETKAAANALGFFGRAMPGLEPHLIPLLVSKHAHVQLEVIKLLGEFGTARSLPALTQLQAAAKGDLAKGVNEALAAIRRRGK